MKRFQICYYLDNDRQFVFHIKPFGSHLDHSSNFIAYIAKQTLAFEDDGDSRISKLVCITNLLKGPRFNDQCRIIINYFMSSSSYTTVTVPREGKFLMKQLMDLVERLEW